ncbi:1,4-dihydroxy-2-naphthoate polyprenyltransferase [Cytophagaceae bacterium YF14B1]|uniref:1,4-dihydroxy-2-naphthoate octaprenyltransferase n=1 Tax=Xanthocytophaga flava TaxID=3048013 RepID=A0AAE3QVZ4_9BACT|nr:1,4-dihydroxy-2-naphthoate polyprenyltransferase [Xanthocytophaga flavus]MDJ1483804.1 1,4-dihydroxy-2-naphthoate polyprenyltransferase [Xanthocytophaga flavus]
MAASLSTWVSAFRLRTLPLALASIGMGSFLAASVHQFNGVVFGLCALTTILLQVLSNLANDYGDSIHGADSVERKGPLRAVQAGHISSHAMRNAVILFSVLSLLTGLGLLYVALKDAPVRTFVTFFGLGILSIIAAITYTAGKKPYGYAGLGDISVLIFFGYVATLGTFYLYTHTIDWINLLPATATGFLSVGVLNVNNIRDIESDRNAGKFSIPVRIGRNKAVIYHWLLLSLAMLLAIIYVLATYHSPWQFLFLLVTPLLIKIGRGVSKDSHIDPYLKQMALTTLLFVILFGIGQLL